MYLINRKIIITQPFSINCMSDKDNNIDRRDVLKGLSSA